MKKLFNGRFLFILASSIVVLILLTLGAFYLFNDEDDTFIKSGYVINPLSSTSEKYFFDKDAGYKENLSSMIEFVDVDKNTVSILKDSFLHYSDESISFLKKGALLDLGSIKGDKAVSFYNISSKSIIEKKDSGYYIESSFGDIKLTNFMGRISDEKYIIAGDLNLKMPGNETVVSGEYFEVVYVEEGIVNIENKDVKFQVAAAGTVISVGSHIKIDLGDKKIVYDNKDVMSITAITIDGDENIEIIPKVEEEEEEEETNPGAGGGSGEGDGDGNGENNKDEESDKGEESDPLEDILITIKDIKIGSTDVDVIFEIQNAREDDLFKLQVVNLNSGKTVNIISSVVSEELIQVNLLTPSTKYLFIVVNEKDNAKYFQKVVETSGFGIKMEKEFATNNSLSYKVSVDENADITNAKLTLYVFNEETKENEIAKKSYTNPDTGEVTYTDMIVNLAERFDDVVGEHSIAFNELQSDTIYTAVLDEFSVASYNFKDIYNITLTSMTLKEVPTFTEMTVDKNVGAGSFDLSLDNIKDPDNAITKYTYLIYDKFTEQLAIEPIVHGNASPLTVDIGEGDDKLKNDTNYYYKVIIEYYDNEKYIEYVTTDSIIFMMGDDPYVTIVPNENLISHVTIGATIYLTDNSCLISMPDRERCNGPSTTRVEVSRINPLTGDRILMPSHSKEFTFEVVGDEIKYNLYLEDLQPGTTYNIEVKAIFNSSDSMELQEILHTDESKRNITTKNLASFNVKWEGYDGNITNVVEAGVQFTEVENSGAESPEETLSKMDKIIIKLYQGERPDDFTTVSPLKTVELHKDSGINFKEYFYDTILKLYSDKEDPNIEGPKIGMGITTEQLKKYNAESAEDEGKLTEYYTLLIEAYVDGHLLNLINPSYQYKVNPVLLLKDVSEPVIRISNITKNSVSSLFPELTNGGTVVGYNVVAAFDRTGLIENNGLTPKKITYFVNDINDKPIKFYVLNKDGELELVSKVTYNLGEEGYHETNMYMDYGTVYKVDAEGNMIMDSIMSRGNTFNISYVVTVADVENKQIDYPSAKGVFKEVKSEKETPSIKMYISKSTNDSVIYKYDIKDPDNAFYKEITIDPETGEEIATAFMYYSVNGGEPQKYELTLLGEEDINHYQGQIIIASLKRGDTYNIFYKKNITKTGEFDKDVLDFLDVYSEGDKIFEGYYNPNEVEFKYQLLVGGSDSNKVGIKIANNGLLDRVVNYKVEFTATYANGTVVKDANGKNVKLVKEFGVLTSCDDNENDKSCLYVDYIELKKAGMRSDAQNNPKNIKVTVTAYYDNGLTGYDYKVGSSSSDDYPYMIMQDDIVQNDDPEAISGSYISFTASGQSVTVWTPTLGAPKGYYTYTLSGSIIKLKSHLLAIEGKTQNVSVNLTSNGYSSKNGYMNPKMISVKELQVTNSATFSFYSITAKANVTRKTGIINGTLLGVSLSGIDLSEVIEEDENYYLYVETWSSLDDVSSCVKNKKCNNTFRPVVRTPININNPLSAIQVLVDGLAVNTNYYYQFYIKYKSKDGFSYTQLLDNKENKGKTYEFKTGKATDYFQNVTLGLDIPDIDSENTDNIGEIYSNRNLRTGINLFEYGFGLDFNFDLIYVLCDFEQQSQGLCGLNEENVTKDDEIETGEDVPKIGNIFQKTIPNENVGKSIVDLYDLSKIDIIYGKKYYLNFYAVVKYYVDGAESTTIVQLNDYSVERQIRFLVEPTFEVTREANIKDNQYYIDFNVTVKDPDRTLINGNYFIKMEDETGTDVFSSDEVKLQAKDDEGNFQKINSNTPFSALELNKSLRVIGLKGNNKYYFTVCNYVHIKNYSENADGVILDDDEQIICKDIYPDDYNEFYDEDDIQNTDEEMENKTKHYYEISRQYTVYTTNTYGIAFGNILFNATSNSFVITFKGGSSFDKITGIDYTIQVADAQSTQQPIRGYYEIPKDKQIEISKESSEYYFVINPKNMKNQHQTVYNVGISFDIDDNGNTIRLSNIDYKEFNGVVNYIEK